MNITEFDKTKYGIIQDGQELPGVDSTTKTEIVWKDKITGVPTYTIPAGERVHVWFGPKLYPGYCFIQHHNEVKVTRLATAHKRLTGISKPPTIKTLQRWEWDGGFCKTVVGEKTEPDGFGPTGAPSWSLVLSLI